jgi:hypothetical protein
MWGNGSLRYHCDDGVSSGGTTFTINDVGFSLDRKGSGALFLTGGKLLR